MKHHVIVIGSIGMKHVYIDVSREEALRRFKLSDDCFQEEPMVKEFDFADEFGAYDAYAIEEK